MKRKDCDHTIHIADPRTGTHRRTRWMFTAVAVSVFCGAMCLSASADSLRLWPTAVVVQDTIPLSDLCELRGFSTETEARFAGLTITNAPPPGGSRLIHADMVRSALKANGANLATITFSGASQCRVERPAAPPSRPSCDRSGGTTAGSHARRTQSNATDEDRVERQTQNLTLRAAVFDYFNREFARYGGRAEIAFDRTPAQVLDLSKPTYDFVLRRRGDQLLGLVQLEVDVLSQNRIVQTIPLVVRVSMVRPVVVTRRAINQDATVQGSDVDLQPISFNGIDRLGVSETSLVIGQRAKRFISAGTQIELGMLEPIPLVTRGQLVTLTSVAGAVSAVTTAKALEDGLYGQAVTVRSADKKRTEFEATVVAPGAVRIGGALPRESLPGLAMGNIR
ncbi:MAG: flagellar basal body P-ring formation chaperone FlgA [Phycisphaerae bacterium]|jgi:flagella basal body P-ring formation protein FlgA